MVEHRQAGETEPPFLLNCWYVAGYSSELADGALVGRTIVNLPVLMYREESGKVVAIANRCPHRFAPLSMGYRDGDVIKCGYHGLGFDGTGACVHNPHGANSKALAIASYPVCERNGILWIWPGDASLADAALVPSYERLVPQEYHIDYGYLHGAAHYELMSDNILDLSHIEFLHPGLGTAAVSRAKVEVVQRGGAVNTVRRMVGEQLPEALSRIYGTKGQVVNRTMSVTWEAPANLVLQVSVEPQDPAESWRSGSQSLHLFTPETEQSTHYFYVSSLARATADDAVAAAFFAALARVFATEDKPMIDAQQAMIGTAEIMTLKPALLPIDKAPVLARRELKRRKMEETMARVPA